MTIRELIDKGWGGQTNFANRYGIPLRTVQNWATGKRTPPDYVITFIECMADNERLKWEKEQIEQELQAYKELVLGKNAPNE